MKAKTFEVPTKDFKTMIVPFYSSFKMYGETFVVHPAIRNDGSFDTAFPTVSHKGTGFRVVEGYTEKGVRRTARNMLYNVGEEKLKEAVQKAANKQPAKVSP